MWDSSDPRTTVFRETLIFRFVNDPDLEMAFPFDVDDSSGTVGVMMRELPR